MTDEVEEPTFVEHAAEQDLQLRYCGGSECFTFDGTPRHETFSISSDCADSCFQTVRNYEHGVVSWAPDPISGTSYKGINLILLMGRSWEDPRWMTYKQAQENLQTA